MIKLGQIAKNIWTKTPKLDPIVDSITNSAKQKRVVKGIVRIVQILAILYLVKEGFIDGEEAFNAIKK